MGVSRVVRYSCDRCGATEDRVDSLRPPTGWGAVVLIPKPQMSAQEPEAIRRVVCDKCLDRISKVIEELE